MAHRQPAAISLAAGPQQVPVIQAVRNLGLAVLAVDRNPKAPGFVYSTERIVRSTYEAEPILEALSAFQGRYRIVGIINRSSGPPVVTAAELARSLELPGVPVPVAEAMVDKALLMALCAREGIPAPRSCTATAAADLGGCDLPYPRVVKPALALGGKRGVTVVRQPGEMNRAFAWAHAAALDGRVAVEEYVAGRDVVLVAFVRGGELHPVTLLDELNQVDADGQVRGLGFAVPSVFSGTPAEADIHGLARRIVNAVGLDTTAFMMSCRYQPDSGPVLTEIHLDLGGDRILDTLLPASTEFDVLGYGIRLLTGLPIEEKPRSFRPVAVMYAAGEGLVTDRPYQLLQAGNRQELEALIQQEGRQSRD